MASLWTPFVNLNKTPPQLFGVQLSIFGPPCLNPHLMFENSNTGFILSDSVLMNLSMYVCPQDLLVQLSCWSRSRLKIAYTTAYRLPVTPCPAG